MVPICFESITFYRALELCDTSNAARRVDDCDMGGESNRKCEEGILETIRLLFLTNEESSDNQCHTKYEENDRTCYISFTIHGQCIEVKNIPIPLYESNY